MDRGVLASPAAVRSTIRSAGCVELGSRLRGDRIRGPGGAEQQEAFEEFTGSIKGVADHGLIYAVADTGSDGYTSGVIRMALSTQNSWNALNSGLIQMAGSIEHNFTQDLEQLQEINQEWQNFDGQVESFDDVLNEQQLVEDPTTGTYYEAPYSSYETSGPDGAGYYGSDGQPLQPVNGS